MEDGAKEDPALHQKKPKLACKAGWLKKAPGRPLASYKDRYILVEKTEVVVYENEDLQNCMERLDLENYDKCFEMKSPFMKKHRLKLIRSPKSGNKIHDVKFQAQTAEEKEGWIKALSDAINRAKNKVFDEVTVEEGSNLEHVTRTRPKGNRNRRPPTRIHMREVADVSSDGILRLDLDLEGAVMPNGNHSAGDGAESHGEASDPAGRASQCEDEEAGGAELETAPQKKVIKPPMPPAKDARPSPAPEEEAEEDLCPDNEVLKLPIPCAKEAKPCVTAAEGSLEGAGPAPPPTPPHKPSSSTTSPTALQSRPPQPPSKDKKPFHPPVEPPPRQQEDEEESSSRKETEEAEQSLSEDEPAEEESEVSGVTARFHSEPESSPEPPRKSPSPDPQPTPPPPAPSSESCTTPPPPEGVTAAIQLPPTEPFAEGLGLHPVCVGEQQKAEERSEDSGQHSEPESEGEDTLAASTAALRGSRAGLDLLDASEDDLQSAAAHAGNKPAVRAKPSALAKTRSASSGDLLADATVYLRAEEACGELLRLEGTVALEMEVTSQLLSSVSHDASAAGGGDRPRDLLAKAMEKLRKAEHVLREVNKLKVRDRSHNRKSW